MLVPKTSVHHYYGMETWKNQIGSTWQIFPMQSKTEAQRMGDTPYEELWLGILRPNTRHILGTRHNLVSSPAPFLHHLSVVRYQICNLNLESNPTMTTNTARAPYLLPKFLVSANLSPHARDI